MAHSVWGSLTIYTINRLKYHLFSFSKRKSNHTDFDLFQYGLFIEKNC